MRSFQMTAGTVYNTAPGEVPPATTDTVRLPFVANYDCVALNFSATPASFETSDDGVTWTGTVSTTTAVAGSGATQVQIDRQYIRTVTENLTLLSN
jgi:hypothetical protein